MLGLVRRGGSQRPRVSERVAGSGGAGLLRTGSRWRGLWSKLLPVLGGTFWRLSRWTLCGLAASRETQGLGAGPVLPPAPLRAGVRRGRARRCCLSHRAAALLERLPGRLPAGSRVLRAVPEGARHHPRAAGHREDHHCGRDHPSGREAGLKGGRGRRCPDSAPGLCMPGPQELSRVPACTLGLEHSERGLIGRWAGPSLVPDGCGAPGQGVGSGAPVLGAPPCTLAPPPPRVLGSPAAGGGTQTCAVPGDRSAAAQATRSCGVNSRTFPGSRKGLCQRVRHHESSWVLSTWRTFRKSLSSVNVRR